MMEKIHYTKPSITDLEVGYATDAAKNGWGEHCYDYIHKFEKLFAEHLGVDYAVATSSCTGAIHLGLAALGIGPGDEVILADTNWIASAAPITYLGAKPVFVDILPDSWCMDPALVEAAVTEKTRAILAVHLYGNLCDMESLLEIGNRHGIPVVEDAAEAIGSQYREKKAGSMGKFGTFSFHGTKTVTTGEGGMLVTNDADLYERVLTLNNHGRARGETRQFWPEVIGFKYKISNIQAAIGCAQLERIEELIRAKRDIFHFYRERLDHLPLDMNPEPEGTRNGYWMPNVVIREETGKKSKELQDIFTRNNIDARVFFWPLSSLDLFDCEVAHPHSYSVAERALNLPSYHDLRREDMERVVNIIENFLGEGQGG